MLKRRKSHQNLKRAFWWYFIIRNKYTDCLFAVCRVRQNALLKESLLFVDKSTDEERENRRPKAQFIWHCCIAIFSLLLELLTEIFIWIVWKFCGCTSLYRNVEWLVCAQDVIEKRCAVNGLSKIRPPGKTASCYRDLFLTSRWSLENVVFNDDESRSWGVSKVELFIDNKSLGNYCTKAEGHTFVIHSYWQISFDKDNYFRRCQFRQSAVTSTVSVYRCASWGMRLTK